jgi:predicted porin
MKKTLVALAALAATGAFAQSSVTIDGYFDRSYAVTNSTDNTKDSKLIGSNAGTTTLGVKVRETLKGGLSIGASFNTDFSDASGANQDSTATTASSIQTGGFANSQSFIDVTGGFGVVRLGMPNNFTLTNVTAVASPAFSTGMGSAYSSAFSIANGIGTGTVGSVGIATQQASITSTANAGVRAIRIANTIQYSSPSFSGLTVHAGYTQKNQNAGTGTDTVGVTEGAVRYTAGPLDAMLSTVKYSVGSTSPTNGSLTASSNNTQNLLGVAYTVMPGLKLHAGLGSFSSSTAVFKGSSQQLGVTFTTGAFDLMAQMAQVDDKSSTNIDRKMVGLGVNYNLSKTARAYVRYDTINLGDNVAAATGSKQNRYAIGVSKSF